MVFEAVGSDGQLLAVKRVFLGSGGLVEVAMATREFDLQIEVPQYRDASFEPVLTIGSRRRGSASWT